MQHLVLQPNMEMMSTCIVLTENNPADVAYDYFKYVVHDKLLCTIQKIFFKPDTSQRRLPPMPLVLCLVTWQVHVREW